MATQRTAQQSRGRRSGQSDGSRAQAQAARQEDRRRAAREDAADPALRGARAGDVHEGQDRRLPASRGRRGGHDRRHRLRDARRRLPDLDLPRARPGAGARHRPEGRDGRAVRQGDRHLARPRRLDAPVRPRAPLHGRLRDRRRQPAARRRAWRSRPTTRARTRSRSACSATAPPTRARSARR